MKIISRADAKSSGLTRYFTGRECPRGHAAERRVNGCGCVECGNETRQARADYHAQYRAKHRDKALTSNRAYYASNAEQLREYARRYRRDNAEEVCKRDAERRVGEAEVRRARERQRYKDEGDKIRDRENRRYLREADRIKARVKKYRVANPDKVRDQRRPGLHAARARKKAAEGRFTTADIRRMHVEQKFICAACPADISIHYHVDHMTPLSRVGGTNWPTNLQLLCKPCNQSKGAKTMAEWIAWKATLPCYLSEPA
jgi:5-methylcytosine-specific restriction endonuclease McrA